MGKTLILSGATALILAGCASGPNISPEQCGSADWHAVGLQHGKAGANITEINTALKACEATSTPVDMARYKEGRAEGLKSYCTPAILLDATIQGTGDPYACDPVTPQMKASIDKGAETRAAVARYQQMKQQYDALTKRRDEINAAGQKWTKQRAQSDNSTNPTRAQIDDHLNGLRQQLAQVNEQIKQADPQMQTEKQTYDAAVQSYEAYKSSLGGGAP